MTDPFKAYDIRGVAGREITEAFAETLGVAVAGVMAPGRVVLGHDVRPSSPALADAMTRGLNEAGVDVDRIGLCATEEVYFATDHLAAGAGIMVTASHNPASDNGFKLIGRGATPLPEGGLARLRVAMDASPGARPGPARTGRVRRADPRAACAARICAQVDPAEIGPLHILADAGNGVAGPLFDAVAGRLGDLGARLRVTRVNHDPDPGFPHGVPNPLLPGNRERTEQAVRASGADFGLAWDGDGDRCFFFDDRGGFVPGELIVALIASEVLRRDPGAAIVHDTRALWAIEDTIRAGGGRPVPARTGHTFMKTAMRAEDAAYGGELSAHHYFREFMFCDSGMIPWLMVAGAVSRSGRPLSELVARLRADHPSSGELNFRVADAGAAMARVEAALAPQAKGLERTDGLAMEFGTWRMSLRASNTEPLLRLNIETRGDAALLAGRVAALGAMIGGDQPD